MRMYCFQNNFMLLQIIASSVGYKKLCYSSCCIGDPSA